MSNIYKDKPFGDVFEENRVIVLTGVINQELASHIIVTLLYYDLISRSSIEEQNKEIKLYISSPGGSVPDGLAILDVMRSISVPVHTIALGECASMAAILLLSGDIRSATKHSRVMLHSVSGNSGWSSLPEQEVNLKLMQTYQKDLHHIIFKKTKVTSEDLAIPLDVWYNTKQAKEKGLIDNIV